MFVDNRVKVAAGKVVRTFGSHFRWCVVQEKSGRERLTITSKDIIILLILSLSLMGFICNGTAWTYRTIAVVIVLCVCLGFSWFSLVVDEEAPHNHKWQVKTGISSNSSTAIDNSTNQGSVSSVQNENNKPRLVMLVGLAKCGTTSLQDIMFQVKDNLQQEDEFISSRRSTRGSKAAIVLPDDDAVLVVLVFCRRDNRSISRCPCRNPSIYSRR